MSCVGSRRRWKDAAQARRLLALAAVRDGMNRTEAARIGGMDRQTLRDWAHRFNQYGPDGLIDIKPTGRPSKISDEQKEALKQLVETGPDPEKDGVVRWRCVDLKRVLGQRFGVDLSEVSLGRALKKLGFSHISARPRHPVQDPEAIAAFKKRMARPVASGFFECAMIGLLQRIRPRTKPGQDGDTRVPVLINFAASGAIF